MKKNQKGAVLLTSLVMLVMLTLFAISMINSSSTGLRIVSNFQSQTIMELGEQVTKAAYLSSSTNFTQFVTQTAVCVQGVGVACTGGFLVKIDKLTCKSGGPATGYSKKVGELVPDDNNFEIESSVSDPVDPSKKHMKIREGVRVRMLAGLCPTSPYVY